MVIYLASFNQNKLREFKQIMHNLSLEIKIPESSYPPLIKGDKGGFIIKETGKTFLENSTIKALTLSKLIPEFVVADDSGLVVPALGGAPGIYSARYAGENATNEERINKLLNEMKDLKNGLREAYFVCSLVLVKNCEMLFSIEEKCYGEIAFEPKGNHGFGYDPIFYVSEFSKTMAELEPEIKNQISHRAKAIKQLNEFLLKWQII